MVEALASQESLDEIQRYIAMLQASHEAWDNEDLPRAESMLAEMLALNPHCREARERLIHVMIAQGRPDEAFDAALDGLRLDPGHAAYHSLLARSLHSLRGDEATIHASFLRAAELRSIDPLDYAALACLALENEQPAEALDWSTRCLALQANHPQGLYAHACALAGLNHHEAAALEFESMLALVTPDAKAVMHELPIAQQYQLCCAHLFRDANLPEALLDREIAQIEAEFGWSVELCWEGRADVKTEAPIDLVVDWLDNFAPGTVRIYLAANKGSEVILALRQLYQVRQEARFRNWQSFTSTGPHVHLRQSIRHLVREWVLELAPTRANKPIPPSTVENTINALAGLLGSPLDWLVELELAKNHPKVRHPRILSLATAAETYAETLQDLAPSQNLPPALYEAVQALILANLWFLADQSGNVINLTNAYIHLPTFSRALQIRDHFRQFIRQTFSPGDEPQLILEIATIAGLLPPSHPIHTQGCLV